MDPAQPHFTETDLIVRLDTSDATFVDIIHTNARPFVSSGQSFLQFTYIYYSLHGLKGLFALWPQYNCIK